MIDASFVYLVRHAKAGDRERWTEPDELRPLTRKGRRQAEGLVGWFRGRPVDRVISSPHVRCVQTVRPLALDRGISVEQAPSLAEGARAAEALELIWEADQAAIVLCSHGDVIPAVVLSLAEGGLVLEGPREWKKGSIWILERRADRFVSARYAPPPA